MKHMLDQTNKKMDNPGEAVKDNFSKWSNVPQMTYILYFLCNTIV